MANPAWIPDDFNTDMGAESGAPQGDVTEEQVRKWLSDNGLDEAEIERTLSMRAGKADRGLEGEETGAPNSPIEGPPSPAMPAPMFPGDRMGQ